MIVKKNGWKRIGIFPLVMVLYVGNGTFVYAQTYTDTQEMTAETQAAGTGGGSCTGGDRKQRG